MTARGSTRAEEVASPATSVSSPTLLRAGVAAGPLYIGIGIAQILTRDGFDMRRHALSLLSNGDFGWVQAASFIVGGLLVLTGAVGVRRLLNGQRAGTWGPILLGVYGVSLVGAGIFVADPGRGFPPGTPEATMSRDGLLHFAFGGLGFYALIAACLVFARRFGGEGRRGWSAYSTLTGIGFFASFAAIAWGDFSGGDVVVLCGSGVDLGVAHGCAGPTGSRGVVEPWATSGAMRRTADRAGHLDRCTRAAPAPRGDVDSSP